MEEDMDTDTDTDVYFLMDGLCHLIVNRNNVDAESPCPNVLPCLCPWRSLFLNLSRTLECALLSFSTTEPTKLDGRRWKDMEKDGNVDLVSPDVWSKRRSLILARCSPLTEWTVRGVWLFLLSDVPLRSTLEMYLWLRPTLEMYLWDLYWICIFDLRWQ